MKTMKPMTLGHAEMIAVRDGLKATGRQVGDMAVYSVPSRTATGEAHIVTIKAGVAECDCKGYHYRGICAHIAAALLRPRADQAQAMEADRRRKAEEAADRLDAALAYAKDCGFNTASYLEYRGF